MTQATRIHQPANFQLQHQGFFMVAFSDAAKIIQEKLSGSVLRLWVYLMLHCPFADYTKDGKPIYKRIESPKEIALILGVSRRTVERDMRKLQELELYEYEIAQWNGHNLSALHAKQESERLKRDKQAQPKPQPAQNDPDKIIPTATNLSQPRQNNPDCDKIIQPLIYNDRALDQTIQIHTDGKDETAAAEISDPIPDPQLTPRDKPSPKDPALQEDQVQNQNIDIVSVENINSGDGQSCAARTNQSKTTGTDTSVPLSQEEKDLMSHLYCIRGDWRQQPWRNGKSKFAFKPEIIQALYNSNLKHYDDKGGTKEGVESYLMNQLNKLDQAIKNDLADVALPAYRKLMALVSPIDLTNPTKPKYFSASEQEQTDIVDMQDPAIKARIAAAREKLAAKIASQKIKA